MNKVCLEQRTIDVRSQKFSLQFSCHFPSNLKSARYSFLSFSFHFLFLNFDLPTFVSFLKKFRASFRSFHESLQSIGFPFSATNIIPRECGSGARVSA